MTRGFGDLRYAHAVPGLRWGTPDQMVSELRRLYMLFLEQSLAEPSQGSSPRRRPVPPIFLRGLALELAARFAAEGKAVPETLLLFLSDCLSLPESFIEDPQPLYSGERSLDAEHEQARLTAEILDSKSIRETGKRLTLNKLADGIEGWFGFRPKDKTLRAWRARPDYAEALALEVIAKDEAEAKKVWADARPLPRSPDDGV